MCADCPSDAQDGASRFGKLLARLTDKIITYWTTACDIPTISNLNVHQLAHMLSPTTYYFPFILSLSAFLMKTKSKKLILIGSVGHHQCYINWYSGPIPIVHTNVHENPLTTFGSTDILKLFNEF